jgi:2-polyprenyl-3-methyl-5-hydroxy-6-metoxy-1,4-benzoquinol methylase
MSQANYDEIADWYHESIQAGAQLLYLNLLLPHLFEIMGDVKGKSICDLACGQGVLSRELARRGAQVVGVDLSTKMLEIARSEEEAERLGITYLQDNAHTLATLADTIFDGVLCNLALMDIPNLSQTFQSVRRILHLRGWFVCSIVHPCFFPPHSKWGNAAHVTIHREVRGYFEEIFWSSDNPHGVRGKVGAYHRMLSTYLNAVIDAGLTLERLFELQGKGEIAERIPGYREVPVIMIIKCRKLSSTE